MHRLFVVLMVVAGACGGRAATPQSPASASVSADPMYSTDRDRTVGLTDAGELPKSVCNHREVGFAPVELTSEQLALRYGEHARTFADAPTSIDRPIEVCAPDGERAWLRRVTCEDGSNPFASPVAARDARIGNVGTGGRCGSIIDLYEVRCPEATYKVFMDMYMCPEGGFGL
jgi:hypothetical protein